MAETAFDKKYPVVLRFEGLHPDQLAGFESHRTRKGGDLGHVDKSRSHLNRPLFGEEDWAQHALAEIAEMRAVNFADEIEGLRTRNRSKDIKKRILEGPKEPWRKSKHGPLRELILTANAAYFDADPGAVLGEDRNERMEAFQECAVAWLKQTFGDDVIHARADLDERAYHIHAIIMPRATAVMTRTNKKTGEKRVISRRRMLQPSKFEVIRDYEKAQDSVGQWFADLNLVRGEKHKEALRKALAAGEEPPVPPRHVRPNAWREAEERRLANRESNLDAREARLVADAAEIDISRAEAEAVMAYAEAVADGTVDPAETQSERVSAGKSASPAQLAALEAKLAKAPSRATRAIGVFRLGWQTMYGEARRTAFADTREAFRGVIDQIRTASEALHDAARLLPASVREPVAAARENIHGVLRRIGIDLYKTDVAEERAANGSLVKTPHANESARNFPETEAE